MPREKVLSLLVATRVRASQRLASSKILSCSTKRRASRYEIHRAHVSEHKRVACPVFLYVSLGNHTIKGTRCINMLSYSPFVRFLGFPSDTLHTNQASPRPKSKTENSTSWTIFDNVPTCRRLLPLWENVVCITPKSQRMLFINHGHAQPYFQSRRTQHPCPTTPQVTSASHLPRRTLFSSRYQLKAVLNSSRPGPWVPTILEP